MKLARSFGLEKAPPGRIQDFEESFDVDIPWIIDSSRPMILKVPEPALRGSDRFFIRFDMYPQFAPSHKDRHFGFWDIPLKDLRNEEAAISFAGRDLVLRLPEKVLSIPPGWRSNLDLAGYGMIHVSLWERSADRPQQRAVKSSQHLFVSRSGDLSLEFVLVSLTHRCNLACPMCMRHVPAKWESADVSPEVLEALLEAAPSLNTVLLGGIGEPLLYRGFPQLVSELKKRMPSSGRVQFNTNGTLTTAGLFPSIVDAGAGMINFSVDGATQDSYGQVRPGAILADVHRNIAETVKYRDECGRRDLVLTTSFAIQDCNVHEIPDFVEKAASLGLDVAQFTHLRDFASGEFRIQREGVLIPLFEQAKEIAARNGIILGLPPVHPAREFSCRFLQSAYILLSGDVAPCCRMLPGAYPGPTRTFGNVRGTTLKDIWNSGKYRRFRKDILRGDLPDVCRGCNYALGYMI